MHLPFACSPLAAPCTAEAGTVTPCGVQESRAREQHLPRDLGAAGEEISECLLTGDCQGALELAAVHRDRSTALQVRFLR